MQTMYFFICLFICLNKSNLNILFFYFLRSFPLVQSGVRGRSLWAQGRQESGVGVEGGVWVGAEDLGWSFGTGNTDGCGSASGAASSGMRSASGAATLWSPSWSARYGKVTRITGDLSRRWARKSSGSSSLLRDALLSGSVSLLSRLLDVRSL